MAVVQSSVVKIPKLNLQLIYEDGRPVRAIVDIAALEVLLEAAEDLDDIEYLSALKREDLEFISFDEYLKDSERRKAGNAESEAEGDDDADLRDHHREAG